jgi:hypothetical protein
MFLWNTYRNRWIFYSNNGRIGDFVHRCNSAFSKSPTAISAPPPPPSPAAISASPPASIFTTWNPFGPQPLWWSGTGQDWLSSGAFSLPSVLQITGSSWPGARRIVMIHRQFFHGARFWVRLCNLLEQDLVMSVWKACWRVKSVLFTCTRSQSDELEKGILCWLGVVRVNGEGGVSVGISQLEHAAPIHAVATEWLGPWGWEAVRGR